jgi:hypothetical protein
MADVIVTPIKANDIGVSPSPQAMSTADTYYVRNNGKVVLHFLKTGAGAATITITTPKTVGGLAVADRTLNVAATTGDEFISFTNRDLYNDASGDLEFVTDQDTGLTVDAIEIV